jgi:hypothetical protein
MFKKGEMPFGKGGDKEDEREDEGRKGSKRKKAKRKGMRMAKGR